MRFNSSTKSSQGNLESFLTSINGRIESLKTQYNLFFSGEIRIPPEGEREALEKIVRDMLVSTPKTARVRLLVQNVSSKFTLYNNMWKKRLNQIESGVEVLKKKKSAYLEDPEEAKKKERVKVKEEVLDISLNREDSFDKFYEQYNKLLKKEPGNEAQKEKVINSLKMKLISRNLIDTRVSIGVSNGKLRLKIKG